MRMLSFGFGLLMSALLMSATTVDARVAGTGELSGRDTGIWDLRRHKDPGGHGQLAEEALPTVPGSAAPVPPPAPPSAEEPAQSDEDVLPDLSGEGQPDDFSVGQIPTVETIELTADGARKAVDAYVLVREKYKDAQLENYENLQDFVEQDAQGKAFEADLKSFGFATANDWNVAITTIGFAYSNLQDDQTEDIRLQIEEIKADVEMAQDMRDRMVQALAAMIPSDNNRKIVEGMMNDPAYAEKLKQLETEEE